MPLLLILSEKTETLDRRTTALSDKMKENGLMCPRAALAPKWADASVRYLY